MAVELGTKSIHYRGHLIQPVADLNVVNRYGVLKYILYLLDLGSM